jgi:hypothetical protein
MVISSFNALNKIEGGSMRELNHYITQIVEGAIVAEAVKPTGLHFLVDEKIFRGTNQPFVQCPIQFRLRGRSPETQLCQPVWTESSQRSKVNRKARLGVKKHSVIRVDDFSVVIHESSPGGYILFIRSYQVVKKNVDDEAHQRWVMG